MRVLRKARNAIAMVHPIGGVRVKIGAIASARRLHLVVAGGILILVINAE